MQAFPFLIFGPTLAASWLAAQAGIYLRKTHPDLEQSARDDLGRVLTATLALLGLIVGFSFSMAVGEYEERTRAEEGEANAIGTEYVRAGLLPADKAEHMRELVRKYLDQRILFYATSNPAQLAEIGAVSARIRSELWSTVQSVAETNPTPVVALVIAGANDVLNSERSTSAAWSNRIPTAGWALLEAITVFAGLLFGYVALCGRGRSIRFFALPLIVSISFFFIADMDNPRDGMIPLIPTNLISLSATMR